MSDDIGTLEITHKQGRARYELLGRMVNGGDIMQLCCSGGWLTGRFEWSGDTHVAPRFFFSIELGAGNVAQESIALPEGALLRWA